MDNKRALSWTLLLVLAVVWGSSFILMKKGLIAFSPMQMAALRISIAALVLTPFLFILFRRSGISGKKPMLFFLIGLTGNAIPAFLFAEAETVIPSGVAGVLNSLSPLFILGVAWLFYKQRFPLINFIGVVIGIGGAAILMTAGADLGADWRGGHLGYSLLIVLAAINYAISANLIKHHFSNFSPILLTSVALCSVGYPAMVYLIIDGTFFTTMQTNPELAWPSLGYIAILAAVGTALALVLFNRLLQISTLAFASSVTYLIPIVAVLWGVLDGETLIWQQGVGFAVVLSGVYLVNRK
jgi:drug/metabolite transporter (DMT)-like permease